MNFNYRSEVDGLRGLAILFVVAYHFQIDFLSGGFVGVDIFFVISGYLITSIILTELENSNSFSFTKFYIGRVRRLAPAFLTMIIFSLPIAYLTLMPSLLVEYSKSVIYAIIFISNIFFYKSEIEYGLEDGIFQPLLHTWSLSVEEQFYIFFPLIFLIIYKFYKKYFLFLVIIASIISIFFSMYYFNNISLVFYSIQFRIWELLLGAGIAVVKINKIIINTNNLFLSISRFASVLLIFLSLYLGYTKVFYPLNVLPATIGTVILILICSNKDFIGKILSSKVLLYTGLISYSLYIWHFPILAFDKIAETNIDRNILFLVSIFISCISYWLIEKPFRNKDLMSVKRLTLFLIIKLAIILTFLYLVFINDGFKKRYYIGKINLDNFAYIIDRDKLATELGYPEFKDFSGTKDNKILIIGNSFGQDLFYSLKLTEELYKSYEFSFIRTQINCLNDFITKNSLCNKKITESQRDKFSRANIIILSSRWKEKDIENIDSILSQLKSLNKKIIVTSPSPEFDIKWKYAGTKIYGVTTMLDNFLLENKRVPNIKEIETLERKYYDYWKTDKKNFEYTQLLENASLNNKVGFLDQSKYYCNEKNKSCSLLTENKEKIFYDYGHRTVEGAKYLGEKIYNQNWLKF